METEPCVDEPCVDALVALGSNLADPLAQLREAAVGLGALGTVTARSSLYRTAPVGGPPGQPDYLNAVVALRPYRKFCDPQRFLAALLALEQRQGRQRRVRWEARSLDLDLLAFGDSVMTAADLTLPHPRMFERAFVLVPLAEIAPAWRHPLTGQRAVEALGGLDRSGVARTELGW